MHEFEGSVDEALSLLRQRMQETLDGINAMLGPRGRFRTYPNPFYMERGLYKKRAN